MPETPTSAAGESSEEPFGSPEGQGDVFEGDLPPDGSDVPDGEYLLKLADIRDQTSKAGNPMWVADFIVAEGAHAGEQVPMFLARTQAAMWKVREFLYAIGMIEKDAEKFSFKKSDAIGRMCVGEVENPSDNPASVRSVTPHPEKRGYRAGVPGGGTEEPAEESDEEAPDDDLPF